MYIRDRAITLHRHLAAAEVQVILSQFSSKSHTEAMQALLVKEYGCLIPFLSDPKVKFSIVALPLSQIFLPNTKHFEALKQTTQPWYQGREQTLPIGLVREFNKAPYTHKLIDGYNRYSQQYRGMTRAPQPLTPNLFNFILATHD